MEQELITSLYELNDKILETKEYQDFKNAEYELEHNEEVALLVYKKDMAIVDYEDTIKHFKKGTPEELRSFKNMNEVIKRMNEHEVIKRYNETLTKLNLLLKEVEDKIFEGIND